MKGKENNVKDTQGESSSHTDEDIITRPRICCIDLDESIVKAIRNKGGNVYEGNFGVKVKTPNKYGGDSHKIILDYDLPLNLHEYDIFIIDLHNFKTVEYIVQDHIRSDHTGKSSVYLSSNFPETLFDPKPLVATIFQNYLSKIANREYLIIVFSSKRYEVEYDTLEISDGFSKKLDPVKYNIYSFTDNIPLSEAEFGKEVNINAGLTSELKLFLEKYKNNLIYNQTFYHPTIYSSGQYVNDENFVPLMTNINDNIISYLHTNKNSNIILLPQIVDKISFIDEFLFKIAPSFFPNLFPYATEFEWKDENNYWLPNHQNLIEEKEELQKEYEIKLAQSDNKIDHNKTKFNFLHDILTESGDNLVKSIIRFLKWIEFEDIQNLDEIKSESSILEEDIQIELDNGLLIIECKGIGGTSTDNDCSQIAKIKHRRCKARGSFDV